MTTHPLSALTRLLFFYAVSLAGACDQHPPSQEVAEASPALSERQCELSANTLPSGVTLQCFWWRTAVNGEFSLPVAVLSTGAAPGTALLHIAGGPGDGAQTNANNLRVWANWLAEAKPAADLILYSPRGTYGSSAEWLCDAYERFSLETLSRSVTAAEEAAASLPILQRCFDTYAERKAISNGLQPGQFYAAFSSRAQAADTLGLLADLGYSRWHLWGVSYGTRVALVAAEQAQNAKRVELRSLILDSVYPPGRGALAQWPMLLERAWRSHEQNSPGFGNLWRQLYQRLTRVEMQPELRLDNWNYDLDPCPRPMQRCMQHQKHITMRLTADRILALSYFVLYDQALLPSFYEGLKLLDENLGEKAVVDNLPLTLVLEAFVASAFAESFSSLVFYATECVDNGRDSAADIVAAQHKFPQWAQELEVAYSADVCALSAFSNPDVLNAQNIRLNIPMLIFAGERDPVTPVTWARDLAQSQPKVTLVEASGVGHSVLSSGYCDVNAIPRWISGDKEVCRRGN